MDGDSWMEDDPSLIVAIAESLQDMKANHKRTYDLPASQKDGSEPVPSASKDSKSAPQEDDITWDDSDAINASLIAATFSDSNEAQFIEDDEEFTKALIESLAEMDTQQASTSKEVQSDTLAWIAASVDKINTFGCVTDPRLENLDPLPDVWYLFRLFDTRFFRGFLTLNAVTVDWSPQMTSCAGLCRWSPRNRQCEIRLSRPLLTLRPRKDLVETLLHEMIHALLFVTNEDDNHESHGDKFHTHMHKINREGGCNITVYHSFHDEVRHYKRHIWRCNGKCQKVPPFFGLVRRARNRVPGPYDYWFSKHQATCGGTFIKISNTGNTQGDPNFDPASDMKGKKKGKGKSNQPDIRKFFTPSPKKSKQPAKANKDTDDTKPSKMQLPSSFVPFSGTGHLLGAPSDQPGPSKLLDASPTEDIKPSTHDKEHDQLKHSSKNTATVQPSASSTASSSATSSASSTSKNEKNVLSGKNIPKKKKPVKSPTATSLTDSRAKKAKTAHPKPREEPQPPVITLD